MQVRQLSFLDQIEYQQSVSSTALDIASTLGFAYAPGWPDEFGRLLKAWSEHIVARPIRTLSLFSGAGGLDIGFHDAGFNILSMIEVEERFVNTLLSNCGTGRYFHGAQALCCDIRNFVPTEDWQIDFMIGGPPCQTFSAAGRRAAGVQGTDDERGMLFAEYVRLLRQLSPIGFLFENVYGLTGSQNGDSWAEIQAAFLDAGYRIFYRVLDAADYGVPQHRERLFIVGVKEGEYFFPRPTHGPDSPDQFPYFTAGEAIGGLMVAPADMNRSVGGRFGYLLNDVPAGLNYSFFTENMGHPKPVFAWRSKFSDFLYKADPQMPVRTIKAQGGQYTGPFHWESRPFSVNELKRLQTIPDSYELVGGRQVSIQQIGNSVPPQLARILALSILNQVFQVQLPFNLPLLSHTETLGFRQRKRELTKIYQKKARSAIALLNEELFSGKTAVSHQYNAHLTEDFGWQLHLGDLETNDKFLVNFQPCRHEWRFFLSDDQQAGEQKFRIIIYPSTGQEWVLPVERVVLLSSQFSFRMFIGLWKAVEHQLAALNIKADLVQLCGYYQYQPSFACSMLFEGETAVSPEWRILQQVVEGVGVRKILSGYVLGDLWNIPPESVLDAAKHLKSIGYEVRNENTNPQIPPGHFLIPYQFPTLSPLSVQLRKSL